MSAGVRKKAADYSSAITDVMTSARALSGLITEVRGATGSLLAMDHIDVEEAEVDVMAAVGRPQMAVDQMRESLLAAEQRMVEVRAHLAMANAAFSLLVEGGKRNGKVSP